MVESDEELADRVLAEAARVPVRRPDPVRWLWYAVGGRLPARHRSWVLHDVTCRTWAIRHLTRAVVQVSPAVVVLFLVIPGSWPTRAAAVLAGLLLGLLYSGAYMHEIVEHRARQAGFPVGIARVVRDRADAGRREAEAERYARTWRRPE
ncbi:hypothetical protein GCM10023321_52540 [Pseudonocardia eucalypti]|uniref:DUF2628 domain-containing protein n=1 Tax=Pseudonocardia eucalypti TaxID=648755 RepID=A0ABP9QMD5_9PSEU|nr:hypothetical protein [Pseudonocardia eucalypti]